MAIKEIHDLDREEQEKHEMDYGGYNDAPPNLEEISTEDFAKSAFFVYDPELIEHRYITNTKNVKFLSPFSNSKNSNTLHIQLYHFYDNTGIGITREYWKGKIHYFKFYLCNHEYRELSPTKARILGYYHGGCCYHIYQCEKCGFIEAHDSSD